MIISQYLISNLVNTNLTNYYSVGENMAGRGRRPTMKDRVPIVVNVEREHLEELKKRDITVAKIVRDGIKKTLDNSNTKIGELKLELEKHEIDFIEEHNKVLELEPNLMILKESGQCSEEDFIKMKADIEELTAASETNINAIQTMLKHNLFNHSQIRNKTCMYGRSKNIPLNHQKEGTVFHHMHLDLFGGIHRNIGIYIPYDLHRSKKHSSITGYGMKDINKAALLWLCEQSII